MTDGSQTYKLTLEYDGTAFHGSQAQAQAQGRTVQGTLEAALAFMISLYCANHLAGGIPAILVNIPGSAGAAATCIDGYQMTKKGQAQQALVLSFVASVAGGLITSVLVLALFALAKIAFGAAS